MAKHPSLYLIKQIFWIKIGVVKNGDLNLLHQQFKITNNADSIALDLGCGFMPQNRFNAERIYGIDLFENNERNIKKVKLGFQSLPFVDCYFTYVTAYDVIEHIPRHALLPQHNDTPFIFFMNEIYRVLKPGGVFLSVTPVYPYLGAFQDPTHNNIITVDTFRLYFSNKKIEIAEHYGITANFEIVYQKMLGQSLVCIMKKNM